MGLRVEELPSHAKMVQNILDVWHSADEDNIERGANWYTETREFIAEYANLLGYDVRSAIGAYAVISPSLDKEQNDKQFIKGLIAHKTKLFPIEDVKIGVYGKANRVKFARCLDGDLTAVGGRKVTSFFKNICGDEAQVTVDRWAVRIALGDPKLDETRAVPSGKKCYEAIKAAYVAAAEQLQEDPCVVQARTWEVWRGQYYRRSADDYKFTRA